MLQDIIPLKLFYELDKHIDIADLYELRLRLNCNARAYGKFGVKILENVQVDNEFINSTIEKATFRSLYAYNHQIKQGYIASREGYRLGIGGEAVLENGDIKTIKNISCIVLRIPHEVKGCADKILPSIINEDSDVKNTLIISPPACGKTTLLRDIARQLSYKVNVLVIDEKNEISASIDGNPSLDLGNAELLINLPRKFGLEAVIRNMSPDVIITDEIYSNKDIEEIKLGLKSGVSIITSIHSNEQNFKKVLAKELNMFDVFVTLGKKPVGKVLSVFTAENLI